MESNGVKRTHSLHIEGNKISINGIESVVSINEKAAVFNLAEGALAVRGGGISLNKLSVDEGSVVLTCSGMDSASYIRRGGGGALKKIFK